MLYQLIEQKFKLTSQVSQHLCQHCNCELNEPSCGELVFHKTGVWMCVCEPIQVHGCPKQKGHEVSEYVTSSAAFFHPTL